MGRGEAVGRAGRGAGDGWGRGRGKLLTSVLVKYGYQDIRL